MGVANRSKATRLNIEKLGINLQTYVNLLSVIKALRLCHRYGKGEYGVDSPITKLPVELPCWTQDVVVEDERSRLREGWSTDARCFESRCKRSSRIKQSTSFECSNSRYVQPLITSATTSQRPFVGVLR